MSKNVGMNYNVVLLKRYSMFFFGMLLFAVGFNLFLLPNSFVSGGVGGLAIIFEDVLGWNPSLFMLIASVVLLLVSYLLLGKDKTNASVLGSILCPVFIWLTTDIGSYIDIDTTNPLIAAVFGGVFCGLGLGLVFKAGFTTGGTDVVKQIANKYFHMSMGKSMILVDGAIVLSAVLVFGFTKLMYSIIVLFIISKLTDKVILGISESKAFYIITKYDDRVRDFIVSELNHGVTIFKVKGGFKGKDDQVLFCVIPTSEYFKLKDGINKIDPKAFFVITDAYEVYGGE